jgi:hypothetical protein
LKIKIEKFIFHLIGARLPSGPLTEAARPTRLRLCLPLPRADAPFRPRLGARRRVAAACRRRRRGGARWPPRTRSPSPAPQRTSPRPLTPPPLPCSDSSSSSWLPCHYQRREPPCRRSYSMAAPPSDSPLHPLRHLFLCSRRKPTPRFESR